MVGKARVILLEVTAKNQSLSYTKENFEYFVSARLLFWASVKVVVRISCHTIEILKLTLSRKHYSISLN